MKWESLEVRMEWRVHVITEIWRYRSSTLELAKVEMPIDEVFSLILLHFPPLIVVYDCVIL